MVTAHQPPIRFWVSQCWLLVSRYTHRAAHMPGLPLMWLTFIFTKRNRAENRINEEDNVYRIQIL